MKKPTSKSIKVKGLKDELDYCIKMVASGHKNPHWAIRVEEIPQELRALARPRKKKK